MTPELYYPGHPKFSHSRSRLDEIARRSEARKTEEVFDFAIIGAGVVGCAIARRFALEGARVVVLEKADDVLDGASKGNSGILHTGFDAPPSSLELQCIQQGYGEYRAIRQDLALPILETGAMVLAWKDEEIERLETLIDQAHQNGVTNTVRLTRNDILGREPNLSGTVLGGLLIPDEHVIDPWSTPHAYLGQALANGAKLRLRAPVLNGLLEDDLWSLVTPHGTTRARSVINAAGLYGDAVDAVLGQPMYEIKPRKGQFVVFDKAAASLLSSIILPVPSETTKGIVLCPSIYGNVLVGPSAEDQDSREDISTDQETLRRLAAKGAEILPGLTEIPITAAYAGLRPATEQNGYRIIYQREARLISVGGIRSTGLSAALGIAQHVWAYANDDSYKAINDPVIPHQPNLAEHEERDWQKPGHGGIVCHCELVTRREIEAALRGPLPANTLAGLKRRTRATMGRCQGFYCLAEVNQMLSDMRPATDRGE